MQNDIKTYAELNRIFVKYGLTANARIWYVLRAMDAAGKGYVSLSGFRKAMKAYQISEAQWRLAREHEQAPFFFSIDYKSNIVLYTGLRKMCEYMDVVPGQTVYVPLESVRTLKKFNAYLYATYFSRKADKQVMISRAKLESLFGLTENTQRMYEKIANVEVIHNAVRADLPDSAITRKEDEYKFLADLPLPHNKAKEEKVFWQYGLSVYWQTVNSYKSKLRIGSVGQSRKIKLNSVEGDFNGGVAKSTKYNKVFFTVNPDKNVAYVKEACLMYTGHKLDVRLGQDTITPNKPESFGLFMYSPVRPVSVKQAQYRSDVDGRAYYMGDGIVVGQHNWQKYHRTPEQAAISPIEGFSYVDDLNELESPVEAAIKAQWGNTGYTPFLGKLFMAHEYEKDLNDAIQESSAKEERRVAPVKQPVTFKPKTEKVYAKNKPVFSNQYDWELHNDVYGVTYDEQQFCWE